MEILLKLLPLLLSKNNSPAYNKISGMTNSAKQINNLWEKFQPQGV